MEALVSVAGSVLETAQGERLLAARVADLAAETLEGSAGLWLTDVATSAAVWSTEGHGAMTAQLALTLSDQVTADLAQSIDGVDRPVLLGATDTDLAPWMKLAGISAYTLFPVVAGGRLIGGLVIVWPDDHPRLTAEDLGYARTLARISGVTLFNSRILADSALGMEELRQHSELIELMSDAVISCDADNQVMSWNAGAERIYGYSLAEATGCDLFALLRSEFLTSDGKVLPMIEVLERATLGGWQGEAHERASDGSPLITMTSMTSRSDHDGRRMLIVVNRDVTTQRREQHEALHDALTGLPNRRLMTLRLYDAYARACRHQQPLAVLFVDLDKFKPINDLHGHSAGDEVLRAVAGRLINAVRQTDTVARIGGDEFVVVLQEVGSSASVTEVTRRILAAVAEPISVADVQMQVSASIGVAHAPRPTAVSTAEDLLEAADRAMFAAKRGGLGMVFAPDVG